MLQRLLLAWMSVWLVIIFNSLAFNPMRQPWAFTKWALNAISVSQQEEWIIKNSYDFPKSITSFLQEMDRWYYKISWERLVVICYINDCFS